LDVERFCPGYRMFLWSKDASPGWLQQHETNLIARFGNALAIIERPVRKRLLIEVASNSKRHTRWLVKKFGGRFEKLPRDWLKRLAREQKTKPLRIGRRLIILNVRGTRSTSLRAGSQLCRGSRHKGPSHIVIPAGRAFGTGEHATTGMSLRMLEQITRKMRSDWAAVDLGTGSGILALAAKRFGAGRVLGIDVDPMAISTARANARFNKIGGIDFRMVDVNVWRPTGKFDLIIANLFSELLTEILPRLAANLAHDGQVIISGVLRRQERELIQALGLNKIGVREVRRRGKWIAILAKHSTTSGRGGPSKPPGRLRSIAPT
jgi:ribosomal protein L11 methyltransferase